MTGRVFKGQVRAIHLCHKLNAGGDLYQSGLTIREALESVSKNVYVLPAIQREFVWNPEQISRLFDSLMQGYHFVGAFGFQEFL